MPSHVVIKPSELMTLKQEEGVIVPDGIFYNTLTNVYEKLGDNIAMRLILAHILMKYVCKIGR